MINIVITISDNYIDQLSSIVLNLKRKGLKVSVVYEFGVITGKIEKEILPLLKKDKKLLSVEIEKEVKIAPPRSLIQ